MPAAADAGFSSVHAVPMRAAGNVLGALGLFGTVAGELNEADQLVAQTLAHVACVAILQDHTPTPTSVIPQLHSAVTSRIAVEQAKGYLREYLSVSMEDAFAMLRRYARAHGSHLTHVARALISDPDARPQILAVMRADTSDPGPHRVDHHIRIAGAILDVIGSGSSK